MDSEAVWHWQKSTRLRIGRLQFNSWPCSQSQPRTTSPFQTYVYTRSLKDPPAPTH